MKTEAQNPEFEAVVTVEDVLAARRITLHDIREHITGPMVSVMLHALLLALLLPMIIAEQREEVEELVVELIRPDTIVPPRPDDLPPLPLDAPQDPWFNQEPAPHPEPAPEVPTPELPSAHQSEPLDHLIPPVPRFGLDNPPPSPGNFFADRLIGENREKKLREGGGSVRTEDALVKGLRWLRDHQNEDGSWGDGNPQYSSALTGLATLAFLAHGETQASAEFGPCVKRSLQRLMAYVEGGGGQVREGRSYSHGIVTYALAEAYAMTRSPLLEDAVRQAATVIVRSQSSLGTYNYDYNNAPGEDGKPRADLSVAAWQYQALKAAFIGGCAVAGIEEAMERGIHALRNVWHEPGKGFGYTHPQSKDTMTAAGVLSLQLLGAGQTREALAGVKMLEQKYFSYDWDRGEQWFLYRTYYQTQAHFQADEGRGQKWRAWNKMFTNTLLRRQFEDGRWETPASAKGTEGHGEGSFQGLDMPVYATAISCLKLSVYYRYLPTHQVVAPNHDIPETVPDDDGLGMKIE